MSFLTSLALLAAGTLGDHVHSSQIRLSGAPQTPEVHSWAALGDSYAAGLGAGTKLSSWSFDGCSRYNSSYPYLLHTHPVFNSSSVFDYLACSGATTKDVIKTQMPQFSTSKDDSADKYDLITLSAGGNDVHLADVLNACIFQWSGGNTEQCETQLNATEKAILEELPTHLDKLLTTLKPHLSPSGKIYQTGYAPFFDASSPGCNNVTWAFWYAGYGWWEKQYLTVERRTRMNHLAHLTNAAVKDATERAGAQVEYVSFDTQFETQKGLFCEPGVVEPMPNRKGLLFFEWDTENDPDKQVNGTLAGFADGTFERQIDDWVREGRAQEPAAVSTHRFRAQQRGDVEIDSSTDSVVPDGYTRVFHPQPEGHAIMAERLLIKMGAYDESTAGVQREEL